MDDFWYDDGVLKIGHVNGHEKERHEQTSDD
jgi:hypothetical protein